MLVLSAGYDQQSAEAAIREGRADAISFGSLFIANPDLPVRFANGWSDILWRNSARIHGLPEI
jgi:N-ethylmaleimide reductase